MYTYMYKYCLQSAIDLCLILNHFIIFYRLNFTTYADRYPLKWKFLKMKYSICVYIYIYIVLVYGVNHSRLVMIYIIIMKW